jgi:hypothetical protein
MRQTDSAGPSQVRLPVFGNMTCDPKIFGYLPQAQLDRSFVSARDKQEGKEPGGPDDPSILLRRYCTVEAAPTETKQGSRAK